MQKFPWLFVLTLTCRPVNAAPIPSVVSPNTNVKPTGSMSPAEDDDDPIDPKMCIGEQESWPVWCFVECCFS